jgi:hypothetical protein
MIYFFVPESGCVPQILDLAAEYVDSRDNISAVLIPSSAAQEISIVRVSCVDRNAVDIPVDLI